MTVEEVSPVTPRARLAELGTAAITRMRPFAVIWMVGAVIVNASAVVLKKPTLASYPGTNSDTVMRLLTYAAIVGVVMLAFKVPVTFMLGPWLERHLRGDARQVHMRHMFDAGIRGRAIMGGVFNAVYNVMFYGLVAYLSPAALASVRVCVIVPLSLIELHARIIRPPSRGLHGRALWWSRFASSGLLTLAGAGIVVFDGGFKLFEQKGVAPIVLLLAMLTVGNLLLAYAEYHEYFGVRDAKVAAPVYSAARIMYYAVALIVATGVWGVVQFAWFDTWSFGVVWHTVLMCVDRYYLVLPICAAGALVDMSRMCVKVIIPGTFMYLLLASSAMADVFAQWNAKMIKPEIYDNVKIEPRHMLLAAGGVVVIIVATLLYPHIKVKAHRKSV